MPPVMENLSVKVGLFRILKINLPCGRISLTDLKLHHFILRSAKKRHKKIYIYKGGCRVAKITLSEKQKELDIDIWIIMIVSSPRSVKIASSPPPSRR